MSLPVIHTLFAFLIGGLFIASQSYLSEKYPKASAFVMTIPSTLALGFIFLVLSQGNLSAINAIIDSIFYVLASAIIFLIVFFLWQRSMSTLGATALGFFVWLLLVIFIRYFDDFLHYIVGIAFITISLFFLNRVVGNSAGIQYEKPREDIIDKIIRFTISGLIISMVVMCGYFFGVFWGSVFAAFPAVFLSNIIIFSRHQSADQLRGLFSGVHVGFSSMIIYVLVTWQLYPHIGLIWGTLIAYIMSLTISSTLIWLSRRK